MADSWDQLKKESGAVLAGSCRSVYSDEKLILKELFCNDLFPINGSSTYVDI